MKVEKKSEDENSTAQKPSKEDKVSGSKPGFASSSSKAVHKNQQPAKEDHQTRFVVPPSPLLASRYNAGPDTQNSKYLQRIYKHPYFYIIDPRTPDIPVTMPNFTKFLDLLKDVLYGYNQIQHGGIKLCTFCFCWVNRKIRFECDPPEPDEVEPEYTMAEALGKMDEEPRMRYALFTGLLAFFQQTGYRPICKPDPSRFRPGEYSSAGSKSGNGTIPPNFVSCIEDEWIPHFPKFTVGTVVHKCFVHYLRDGAGVDEAKKAKLLARERVRLRRREPLYGGPHSSLGEMVGLHPQLTKTLEETSVIPTDSFEKKPSPKAMRGPLSNPMGLLDIFENELIPLTLQALGFEKLAVAPNPDGIPVRMNLAGCKFYTNKLGLDVERIRRWVHLQCTGIPLGPRGYPGNDEAAVGDSKAEQEEILVAEPNETKPNKSKEAVTDHDQSKNLKKPTKKLSKLKPDTEAEKSPQKELVPEAQEAESPKKPAKKLKKKKVSSHKRLVKASEESAPENSGTPNCPTPEESPEQKGVALPEDSSAVGVN